EPEGPAGSPRLVAAGGGQAGRRAAAELREVGAGPERAAGLGALAPGPAVPGQHGPTDARRPPVSTPIRAAAYYRRSTALQEDSFDRQQSQVEALAEREGYSVVTTYQDDAIAGDHIEKRKGFCRMLEDARAGRFTTIVCDSKDRFGRFDLIDA